jgi:hypothetical protein
MNIRKLVADLLINMIKITSGEKWGLNATIEYRVSFLSLHPKSGKPTLISTYLIFIDMCKPIPIWWTDAKTWCIAGILPPA